jgi:hypothetical protein
MPNETQTAELEWIVKRGLASLYNPLFRAKINNFDLKYCILKENTMNTLSGSNDSPLIFARAVMESTSDDR